MRAPTRITLSEREYAQICLNCPFSVCKQGENNGCSLINGYREPRTKEYGRKKPQNKQPS